jgi:L-rhamnose mutarotase
MTTYVLALDLENDRRVIAAYKKHHRAVWPEVVRSLKRIGIREMEIFLLGARLVMLMTVPDGFDRKRAFAAHVAADPKCAEWELFMKTFQRKAPGARRGEWWAAMTPVFRLSDAVARAKPRRGAKQR